MRPSHNRADGHRRARAAPRATHEVFNQPRAAGGLQPVRRRPAAAARRSQREGAELGRGARRASWARSAARRRRSAGAARPNENKPLLQHPRPLRQPHRRGRVPPLLARADADRRRPRPARARPGASRGRGAHVARAAMFMLLMQAEAGVGCPISMTYSAIPALRTAARARRRVGAALPLARLRRRSLPAARQERRALRDGDDREAGRLRRAREHHRRRAAERRRARRRVRDHRPQVVLLGADVRRVPRPRADRRRALLLPAAALDRPTASATPSTSSGSRTSSATAPTPPARSSSAAPGRAWSARRAAACRRSSRWSTTPGSTA